jgi:hypothetical protein
MDSLIWLITELASLETDAGASLALDGIVKGAKDSVFKFSDIGSTYHEVPVGIMSAPEVTLMVVLLCEPMSPPPVPATNMSY